MTNQYVYVGTYTSNGGEGIYLFSFNPETGALHHLRTIVGVVNPSFLAFDPKGRFLYAVNEVGAYYGKNDGALSAFAIDPETGELRFLNQQPSQGAAPCHLSLDHTGSHLFVANYDGGNLAVFPLAKNGSLGGVSCRVAHQGCGPDADRQKGPHVHCVLPDPFNRHVLAVDLGCDRIFPYAYDSEHGTLRPAVAGAAEAKPGSGPRHLVFHPNGKWSYVVHELESRVTRFLYNGMTGALAEMDSLSSLPSGFQGENFGSGIEVDSHGRFLYVSNRGHDSIALFRIDQEDGSLEFSGCTPTRGKFPRHFSLDPSGRFLLVANQRSDSLTVFRVDRETGKLEDTGRETKVPSPVCVRMHRSDQR